MTAANAAVGGATVKDGPPVGNPGLGIVNDGGASFGMNGHVPPAPGAPLSVAGVKRDREGEQENDLDRKRMAIATESTGQMDQSMSSAGSAGGSPTRPSTARAASLALSNSSQSPVMHGRSPIVPIPPQGTPIGMRNGVTARMPATGFVQPPGPSLHGHSPQNSITSFAGISMAQPQQPQHMAQTTAPQAQMGPPSRPPSLPPNAQLAHQRQQHSISPTQSQSHQMHQSPFAPAMSMSPQAQQGFNMTQQTGPSAGGGAVAGMTSPQRPPSVTGHAQGQSQASGTPALPNNYGQPGSYMMHSGGPSQGQQQAAHHALQQVSFSSCPWRTLLIIVT